MKNWRKIGQILVARGEITPEVLNEALESQAVAVSKRLIGDILTENGYIDETALYSGLAEQWGLEFAAILDPADIDNGILELFPLEHLRRIQTFPVHLSEEVLFVASSDPLKLGVIEELTRKFKKRIRFVVIPPLRC